MFQKGRFIAGQWMQAFAMPEDDRRKWMREGGDEAVTCDEGACRFERHGHRVSFLKSLVDFSVECAWADVLIGSDPLPVCASAEVIDRFSVRDTGGAALYLEEGDVHVEYTLSKRHARPWTAGWAY